MLEKGADVDIQNDIGDTPLHVSVAEGHIEIINLLIEYNASLDKANKNRETPFDKALMNNNDEVFRLENIISNVCH